MGQRDRERSGQTVLCLQYKQNERTAMELSSDSKYSVGYNLPMNTTAPRFSRSWENVKGESVGLSSSPLGSDRLPNLNTYFYSVHFHRFST